MKKNSLSRHKSAIAHKELDLDGPCSPNEDIIAAQEDGSALSVLDVALHVVVHEIQLVRYCRQDTSAWDFRAQRVLAGRYAANLYTQLIPGNFHLYPRRCSRCY